MIDPSRKRARIPSVKKIFLRRSGVRKALANAESTRPSLSSRERPGESTRRPRTARFYQGNQGGLHVVAPAGAPRPAPGRVPSAVGRTLRGRRDGGGYAPPSLSAGQE